MTDSIRFFDEQFQRQVSAHELALNPFEQSALPLLAGDVLDFGCGLGNLSLEAARRGCRVTALDASPSAIKHIRDVARREALPVHAQVADLSDYPIGQDFDAVVCIGLLMSGVRSTPRNPESVFHPAGPKTRLSGAQRAVRVPACQALCR